MLVDDRGTSIPQWAITVGAVVALAVVPLSLLHGRLWALLALVGGVTVSHVLLELGQRYTTPANEARR